MLNPTIAENRTVIASQATMNCVAKIDKQLRKVKRWGKSKTEVLLNLDQKLIHLPVREQKMLRELLRELLREFAVLLPDVPGRTTVAVDVADVGDSLSIKQHPYRVNPEVNKTRSGLYVAEWDN